MTLWHHSLVLALAAGSAAAGCRSHGPPPMYVAAAVSLSEAMTTAVDLWRRETGEAVSLNFAASNVLSRQIEAGAPADLFISADAAQMDRLVARGAIDARSVVPLLTNQLVVIAAPDRPVPGPMPAALADPRVVRIALGDWSAVPAGVYARGWLERIDLWRQVAAKAVPTGSVRAAMAAVEAGNADTAVVYRTDVTGRDRVVVVYEVPIDRAPRIVYPAGIVANSRQHDRARRLLKWLRGATASRGFDEAGFGVPEAAPVR